MTACPEAIASIFERAGCDGQLCVGTLLGTDVVGVDEDRAVVAASVIKVLIALEVEIQIAEQRLDPARPITISRHNRTPGPVGFSLYDDDVTASLRDLVVAALTISDNAATDALLGEVGMAAVNERAARLGLAATVVESDLAEMIGWLVADTGFSSFAEMTAWMASQHDDDDVAAFEVRLVSSRALTPASTTRTTPRDMAALLRLIWTDRAGPLEACRRIRVLMGRQLTRHRIAAGFPNPVRVAAKSGGLMGVVRNEVGVIEFPAGAGYVAAVFTRSSPSDAREVAVNEAIGSAAAAAVATLRRRATDHPGA